MSIQISKVPLVSSFGNFTNEVIAVFSIGAGGEIILLFSLVLGLDKLFLPRSVDLFMALILAYYLRRGKSGFEKYATLVS